MLLAPPALGLRDRPPPPTERAGQVIRLENLHHFLRTLHAGPPDRASTTTRAGLPTPQDRTVGRNRGHPWGETMAASGEIQWPPMGRFPWPPSAGEASQKAREKA